MESLEQSYTSVLNFTNRNLRRYSTEQLRRASLALTVDQWGVLKLLEEQGGRMSFAALSSRMLRDKPTLTRIVDRLVRDGLVKRGEDPDDRRRLLLTLSSAGARKVRKASLVVGRLRGEVARGISRAEQETLKRILGKINANIDRARGRASEDV